MKVFNKKVYMDYASSTPIEEEVLKVLNFYNKNLYANPSGLHQSSLEARKKIEEARASIARSLYAHSNEIIFCGSATESIIISFYGVILNYKKNHKNNPHIITTKIEHPAILETCKKLSELFNVEVSYLDVDENGILDQKLIKKNLKKNTVLVSVHYANNEIGVIQKLPEITKELRHFKKNNKDTIYPLFHIDASQAVNYLPFDNMEKLGADLISFNSSKIYGPKGIALLFKKRNVILEQFITGGGQEFNLRSGTESLALIGAFTKALEITEKIKEKENARLIKLQSLFISGLKKLEKESNFKILLNGSSENRLANNINISIDKIDNELILIELDSRGVEISSKSSCKSKDENTSYVIKHLRQISKSNFTDESLRFSLGRQTKKEDILYALKALKDILLKYKEWK